MTPMTQMPRMPTPAHGPTPDPRDGAPRRSLLDGLGRFVARRVPAGDADDLVQDILLRLQQAGDRPEDPSRWVYGVARHAVADYHRRRARDPLARSARLSPEGADEGEGVWVADDETIPEAGFGRFDGDHSVHEEVLSWLRPLAEELPETYRDAVLLADFEGMPQAEVARRLGIGSSAAKSRVQRGRVLLRRAVEACCEIERDGEGRVTDFRRRDCDC